MQIDVVHVWVRIYHIIGRIYSSILLIRISFLLICHHLRPFYYFVFSFFILCLINKF